MRSLINQTIKVVESLKTREEVAGQVRAPTFRPKGAGVFVAAFEVVFFLALAVLVIGYGMATMVGLLDYRTGCFAFSTATKCLDTPHAYSVFEAIFKGGKFVLVGAIPTFGVFHSLERIRTLRRIKKEA